jgi:hypothetical protein
MSRLAELNEWIEHFNNHYHCPQTPGGLCRTANMTQLATYNGWVKERDELLLKKEIWCLSYYNFDGGIWKSSYFSTEELAKNAKAELLKKNPEHKEFHYSIRSWPVDE